MAELWFIYNYLWPPIPHNIAHPPTPFLTKKPPPPPHHQTTLLLILNVYVLLLMFVFMLFFNYQTKRINLCKFLEKASSGYPDLFETDAVITFWQIQIWLKAWALD